MNTAFRALVVAGILVVTLLTGACAPRPGDVLRRRGDEIMVCGQLVHTGAPVVLWTDPGGYDAYRTERRFVPWANAAWKVPGKNEDAPESPNRLGIRYAPRPERGETDTAPLSAEEFEQVRGGGWDLPLLQKNVDQFVLHYDVCGVSRSCFRVLHDFRGLSVQFMLDIDGTIYQTMDLKDKAWHATRSNNRSVGVEIANMGAYAKDEKEPWNQWYEPDLPAWGESESEAGNGSAELRRITIPDRLGDGGVRGKGVYRPARSEPVYGPVQGRVLRQMDLTPEQYRSLIKLTAALHKTLPRIELEYPRDEQGQLIPGVLSDESWRDFQGVLGHYHIQRDKADPGPALDWEKVINGARRELGMPKISPKRLDPTKSQTKISDAISG